MLLQAMSPLTWAMYLLCPVLASPAPTFDSLDGRSTAAAETRGRTSLTADAVTSGHTGVATMLNNLNTTTTAVPTTLTTTTARPTTTATKTMWGTKPEPTGITSNPSFCRYRQKYGPWQIYISNWGWKDGSDACAKVGQYMRGTGAIFKKKGGEIMSPEKWCRHPTVANPKGQDPEAVVMDFDFLQAPFITNWFFKHYVRHAVRTASGNPNWDFHCQSQCGSMPLRSFVDYPPVPPPNGELPLDQGNSSFTDDPDDLDDPDDPPEDTWTSWFSGPPRGRMCFPYPPL